MILYRNYKDLFFKRKELEKTSVLVYRRLVFSKAPHFFNHLTASIFSRLKLKLSKGRFQVLKKHIFLYEH